MSLREFSRVVFVNVAVLLVLLVILFSVECVGQYFRIRKMSISPSDETWSSDFHQPDPVLGWALVPNCRTDHQREGAFETSYIIDSHGRKKVEGNNPRNRNAVYFFGDSFTFGQGVSNDDTFAQLVKNALPNLNVYNYGVDGYGLVQMYQSLLLISPELLVGDYVFFTPISRDYGRTHRKLYRIIPFRERSHIVPYVSSFPRYDEAAPDMISTYTYTLLDRFIVLYRRTALYALFKNVFCVYDHSERDQFYFQEVALVSRAASLCREKGVTFVYAQMPSFADERETFQRDFSGEYQRVGVSQYDIRGYFEWDEFADRYYHSKKDTHYNKLGHQVVATAFSDYVIKKESERLL